MGINDKSELDNYKGVIVDGIEINKEFKDQMKRLGDVDRVSNFLSEIGFTVLEIEDAHKKYLNEIQCLKNQTRKEFMENKFRSKRLVYQFIISCWYKRRIF